jgi:Zn-dependent M28 family amino/carboxypeptidase
VKTEKWEEGNKMSEFKELIEDEKQLVDKVSKETLMEYTHNITKEVRLSGTKEELNSFKYVQHTLESFGLKTKMLFYDAYISLPRKSQLIINGISFDCITHSMAESTTGIEAELVEIDKESLDREDVVNKIVIIEGFANRETVKKASEKGAIGAIFINSNNVYEMIVSPVWGNPVPETIQLLPKIPVVSINKRTSQLIRERTKQGENRCEIKTYVETKFCSIPTLIAEIPGNEESDKFVLFSGHIDSWHYGVMDNGTANATMIEVAKILTENKHKLRRTLRLAFWSGHSHGRYAGSTCYCDEHWEEITENCILHINIDSVGAKGADILTKANCMEETKDLAKDVIGSLTGQIFEGSRFGRGGDQSFWGTGTPSLFMGLSEQGPKDDDPSYPPFEQIFGQGKSGGFGWWWHTPEDTLDKIDPDHLVRDCQIYLIIIYRALIDIILPINQYAAVQDVKQALLQWQKRAGNHINLNNTMERIEALDKNIFLLNKNTRNISIHENEKVRLINKTIMELSRILVPLNYVKGSIYDHDLAMRQPPVPKLSDINQLVEYDSSCIEYKFVKTALLRRINEINSLLKQANEITKNALEFLYK